MNGGKADRWRHVSALIRFGLGCCRLDPGAQASQALDQDLAEPSASQRWLDDRSRVRRDDRRAGDQ